jgi:aspartate aminotransferase-like enzyme
MSQSDHAKLFIPGPVEVSQRTYQAMTQPMIGHRSKDFQELYADIQPGLREMFGTERAVYLSTSSAWGIMEGALRNLTKKRVLNCMCGAFSDKWNNVAKSCGKEADGLQVEWGDPVLPNRIDEALSSGDYDVMTLVHNETSTGVMNPLGDIAEVMKKHKDVFWITDTVSSFSVVPTPVDDLGMDVMLTGSQKALALPPGLSLFTVSERAMERAATVEDRGYYFDFLEFKKNQEKDMTPSTPTIALIYALRDKVKEITQEEGLTNRYHRHSRLNTMVHDWVIDRGFEFFAQDGYRSKSLTCVANNKDIDVADMKSRMAGKGFAIDGGYGKIKGKTFRISNMGNETEDSIKEVLSAFDATLSEMG